MRCSAAVARSLLRPATIIALQDLCQIAAARGALVERRDDTLKAAAAHDDTVHARGCACQRDGRRTPPFQ
jgi:hypothetical protein